VKSLRREALSGAVAVVGFLVLAAFVQLPFDRESMAPSARLAMHAGAVTSTAWLWLANAAAYGLRRDLPTQLLVAAAAALATVALILATGPIDARSFGLGAGTFVLVACFAVALSGLEGVLQNRLLSTVALITVTSLLVAAPLWLGPVVESFAGAESLASWVLALSPFSYLAVLADFDFLRTSWFYEHSVLGSLRYRYPSAWMLTALYCTPVVVAVGLRLRSTRPRLRKMSQSMLAAKQL